MLFRFNPISTLNPAALPHGRRKLSGESARGISSAKRAAFTLLELMLVLAIITVIAAITVPALGEIMERQKLRSATTRLRLRWDEARIEAMTTGQAQVFECTLETSNYTVKPLMLGSDSVNASPGAVVAVGGGLVERDANGIATAADTSFTEGEKLEEDMLFQACMVAGDARAYAVAQQAQQELSGLNNLTTNNIAQRVIFYPDGSTSTAEVQLKNSRGDVRAIQIRGITGHTRVLQVTNVASGEQK